MKAENVAKDKKKEKEWPSNLIELSGYAGCDPVFKRFAENRLQARFSLGTHQLFRDKNGQWIRTTVWHTIVSWDYAARKTVDMVRRGSHVSLKGRLRSYETEIGGGKKENRVYVIANDLTVNIAA